MPENSGLMRGKRGLIMGVANNRSLGWGIAKSCRAHGAELASLYQGLLNLVFLLRGNPVVKGIVQ